MTLLATDLKVGTKTVHIEAEHSKFIRWVFKARSLLQSTFDRLLVSLYHVYRQVTLDLELDKHKDNLNVQLVYFLEELFRKETLETDLEFYNVFAKKLQKHTEPPESGDVAFCQFDMVENRDMFKELFRKKLNQVQVDEHLQQQVKVSCKASAKTIELFQER
ncbi:heme oxygenase (decycling) 1 [Podila minutissima]|nr:heme oxygenase (decycling) 1 [Podila minutissima]